ncbi:DUF3499 domain-containing protein [Cellulomonas marina]|uniref:DUF3499 domain-containing protein n=1 Tax=Cellulomonas marina TaxID=988821 RepID=A0A1I0UZH2_9CELL|nr:DUF3499 domain-containing protein [Cellulomonas marina]GIG29891.1 hypothetical protein Cma02nite_24910 [Cellulomonas marina]SFA69494.1 Protein of unknown function [Cellulomonas marina]
MRSVRTCSRTACDRPAAATLTYVYADSTAVLGPLAQLAEPHSYDLCPEHAERLTAPRGWEVVRLMPEFAPTAPSTDDLVALADAVREAGRRPGPAAALVAEPAATLLGAAEGGLGAGLEQRRGHLRVVRQDEG